MLKRLSIPNLDVLQKDSTVSETSVKSGTDDPCNDVHVYVLWSLAPPSGELDFVLYFW